jgi:hypothetical protein
MLRAGDGLVGALPSCAQACSLCGDRSKATASFCVLGGSSAAFVLLHSWLAPGCLLQKEGG